MGLTDIFRENDEHRAREGAYQPKDDLDGFHRRVTDALVEALRGVDDPAIGGAAAVKVVPASAMGVAHRSIQIDAAGKTARVELQATVTFPSGAKEPTCSPIAVTLFRQGRKGWSNLQPTQFGLKTRGDVAESEFWVDRETLGEALADAARGL